MSHVQCEMQVGQRQDRTGQRQDPGVPGVSSNLTHNLGLFVSGRYTIVAFTTPVVIMS